jgi:hypothetical protein
LVVIMGMFAYPLVVDLIRASALNRERKRGNARASLLNDLGVPYVKHNRGR